MKIGMKKFSACSTIDIYLKVLKYDIFMNNIISAHDVLLFINV